MRKYGIRKLALVTGGAGNPDEFTILELAKKVLDLTGSKSVLVFKPLPGGAGYNGLETVPKRQHHV